MNNLNDLNGLRPLKIGLVSISDRASSGVYADEGLPALQDWLTRAVQNPLIFELRLIPDEQALIEANLVELCDVYGCELVFTTGGTGPAPRDETPEALADVIEKELEGFGEAMRRASLDEVVPTAILSRQGAGTRGKTLIITLPGKPSAIATCLDAVFPAVPYCLDLMGAGRIETNPAVCKAFRPKA